MARSEVSVSFVILSFREEEEQGESEREKGGGACDARDALCVLDEAVGACGLGVEWVVGGAVRVCCAGGAEAPEGRRGRRGNVDLGSSMRSKGASAASTSTSDSESGEEVRALHWERRLGILARSVAVRQLHRLLRRRGPHRLVLSNSPTFTNPRKTALFFDAGSGSSRPWLLLSPVPQWSSLTVRIARDLQRLATPPDGSRLSAVYVGITHGTTRGRILNNDISRPGAHMPLWLHSADRVGTDITSTSVTQRSAPLQKDKHPALVAENMTPSRVSQSSSLPETGLGLRACSINTRSCHTLSRFIDVMHERVRRPSH
jgi:hypothetical protein